MKKTRKLALNKESLRTLTTGTLARVVGGLTGPNCHRTIPTDNTCTSLGNTACQACYSDVGCVPTDVCA